MIVAETATGSMDRAGEVEGYSDAPQDDFVTYLLSRFSEPQKRMFAESYGLYMREDMRNKFCIDLDLAFKWLGFTRKDSAVNLMQKHLIEGQDFAFQWAAECANWTQNGRIADKYMLTPRGFKKLLMRARTEQGDAAIDYFLEIEDALLAYDTLKRTHTGVSQFDSSAKARRNGLRLRSVTDSINTHVSGLYFGAGEDLGDVEAAEPELLAEPAGRGEGGDDSDQVRDEPGKHGPHRTALYGLPGSICWITCRRSTWRRWRTC